MNRWGFCLLVLYAIFFRFCCKAQPPEASDPENGMSNFQPSLAVVIGILCLMFSLTFFILMYAKFCHRRASVHGDPEIHPARISSRSRFSGIDKTVIESLPFFRFSSLRGSKEGLECAVCLSKFEDVEILRMLPKCKHAFHINCIDHWLEKHSSCPLCRRRVNPDDQTIFANSNSMRLLTNQPELGEESNIELFVEREEEHHGSSRFSIGSSFRKIEKGIKEEEFPIQKEAQDSDGDDDDKVYHKHNHKIIVSDVVFKNRWSNVSSSDLMFLKSEMLSSMSSRRFNWESQIEQVPTARAIENEEIINIKEEMERKISIESKVGVLNKINTASDIGPSYTSDSAGNSTQTSKYVNPGEKRSMSEITAVSRYGDWGMKAMFFRDSSLLENNVKEERVRQLWLPIARRTVKWFVNRERRSQNKQQPLDV
ncbi:hypothetical protein L6164_005233 [Bauhinia variegata]|uniref:Uncharacterized protein n=1 Tax=Bauhinia variegata TaxID=167791 RepID=A0ACB9PPR6_BAUVA|nr:hypothetical protein L6164_005233 [Bauhinia variegata]